MFRLIWFNYYYYFFFTFFSFFIKFSLLNAYEIVSYSKLIAHKVYAFLCVSTQCHKTNFNKPKSIQLMIIVYTQKKNCILLFTKSSSELCMFLFIFVWFSSPIPFAHSFSLLVGRVCVVVVTFSQCYCWYCRCFIICYEFYDVLSAWSRQSCYQLM